MQNYGIVSLSHRKMHKIKEKIKNSPPKSVVDEMLWEGKSTLKTSLWELVISASSISGEMTSNGILSGINESTVLRIGTFKLFPI